MTNKAWKVVAYTTFPWENNYFFEYFKKSTCILKNTKPRKKEIITRELRTATLPKRRYRKIEKLQNLWDTEQTQNGQNPDIINTLF
jgi:hypothetical protein